MTNPITSKKRSEPEHYSLLKTLQTRFGKNMHQQNGIIWEEIHSRLQANPQKLL